MTKDVFDEHADRYSETINDSLGKFGASHDFFTQHKARLIPRLLKRNGLGGKNLDLLDVGCGIGVIHPLLRSEFRSVSGVDVSVESISEASRRFPENRYLSYDGHTLPAADGSYDVTMAICVFHHVPPASWQNLSNEMMRVLRPGGLSLVIEHNPWNPVTRHIVNSCPIDRDAVLLRRGKVVELFERAGGNSVKARCVLSVPSVNDALMIFDDIVGLLPFGAQYWCTARKS
jgi:ubiquinone/menaquinone biosynthesis C-methylase UbiE